MMVQDLDRAALDAAKAAFTTRRAREGEAARLITGGYRPRAGDVVLARVEEVGQHSGVQLRSARRAQIFVGDLLLLAYGTRYAPDQFEAALPEDLGACHLAAAGGIAAAVVSAHAGMKPATRLAPVGVLARADERPLNLADYALAEPATAGAVPVIAVAGTSMNAGKTTSAAALVRGLSASGFKVGAAKLTGTGACADACAMIDSGARDFLDFTDAGLASTHAVEEARLLAAADLLLAHLAARGAQVIVAEIADGIYQRETAALLASPLARTRFTALVFAAGEAAGAAAGIAFLRSGGLPVRAISGLLSLSHLGAREAEAVTGLPVLSEAALATAGIEARLAGQALRLRRAS